MATLVDYQISQHILSGNDESLTYKLPDHNLASDHIRRMFEQDKLTTFSEDSHVNNHGKRLLDLCKTTGLLIINGRVGLNKGISKYTRWDTTGCTLVDYAFCSTKMFRVLVNSSYMKNSQNLIIYL